MKRMRYLLYGAIILSLLLLVGGCGWVDQLRSYKEEPQDQGEMTEQPSSDQGASIVEQRLGLAEEGQNGVVAGAAADPAQQPPATSDSPDAAAQPTPSAGQDTKEVLLYYVSTDSGSLVAEQRAIPKEEGLARATVQQLLSGPRDEDLQAVIPGGVTLRDIDVSNGLCTVDLSADLTELASISQDEQMLALYSLVNTLGQFDSVEQVQVLLNGQTLQSLGGVDVSQALAPLDLQR